MNMKCMLGVVTILLGRFLGHLHAKEYNGTESNPFQVYVKKGFEAVLQCKEESSKLAWSVRDNDSWSAIASGHAVGDSTKYKVSTNPSTGKYYKLHVLNTQPDDELLYRCDIGKGYVYQLNFFVPPKHLTFHGLTGDVLQGKEGSDLEIRCIADGGKPPPNVTILDGTQLIDDIQEVNYRIPMISRDYHQKWIVCEATSDAIVSQITTRKQIYLKLTSLTPIFNKNEVSAEETVPLTVSCTSYGSRPAATFTWSIGGNNVTTNSTTSQPVRESNDTETVKSTLIASVDRINDNQVIICQASNTVGIVSANKTLDVKYAPDITVTNHTYEQTDAIRNVTCNPSGNPDRYTYHRWQHKSKYGEIIQEFGGDKTLNLSDVPIYQNSGEYVCTASNSIKDKDNKIKQTGSGYVTINARPVFTSDNNGRVKQFGEFNKAVDIYVNVYSVPKFTSKQWFRGGKEILTHNSEKYQLSSYPHIVKDKISEREVQLDGYKVTLTIHNLEKEDFSNYTVTLMNRLGTVNFTIVLESASRPEIPGNFSSIASSSTSITVQWDPNASGGYKQTFYIQYKVLGSSKWRTVPAGEEDIDEQRKRRTYVVGSLEGGTAYELRMFAENTAMKRSNYTEIFNELTRNSDAGSSTGALIGGVAGSLIAIIIVLLVIVCVLKKRKERSTPSMKLRTSSEADEDDGLKDNILYESSQSDGLKKNALYQSAGPDFESQNKTSTSSEYAVVQKPNAIYAAVNKDPQSKMAKAKKQKEQKDKPKKTRKVKAKAVNNNPEEEYANSALPLQNLKEEEYANSTDAQGPSTNAPGLEYADLTFRQIPGKNKKQVIHGNDERTLYADVDHTKKAPPPPPESEYEETNIKHGKIA